MDYYRNTVTEESRQLLTELARAYEFTLIGGWAVWLSTHALKSKDIDIIIDLAILGKLRDSFDVTKKLLSRLSTSPSSHSTGTYSQS